MVFCPSNLHSLVSTTVRIGTLMPAPRVSVPQMTRSRPSCASCSTSTRYFGSSPAWCRPMPCFSHLRTDGPYGLEKSTPSIRAAISFFCSRVAIFRLVKSCALAAASACVKCTT